MVAVPAIDSVILSWPRHLSDMAEVKPSGKRRSWIQLARCGSFQSNRYGKFAITKDDLKTMAHNFANVTPKHPTELPIDYDHLSMDPKKPGDGIAAGWMKSVELRNDGDELWGEVEWTPDGAKRVADGEYRFISPSFVKDHTHKDGKKIGTTLLAAAVTNHPFLEGMSALSLYNFSAMGDLAMDLSDKADVATSISLSETGQRVMIAPGMARTHDEVGGTFEITDVVGSGEDAFVTLKDANGVQHKWFRSNELLPAPATPMGITPPNLQPGGLPPRVDAVPAAAGGTPGALVVPPGADGALPGSPTPGVTAGAPGEENAKPSIPGMKSAEAPKAEQPALPGMKKSEDPATGDAVSNPFSSDDDDDEEKAKAGFPAKRINMSKVFTLRNDKDEEVQISLSQLEAAGIKVVPEGSQVIGEDELTALNGKIVSLSSAVDTLAAAAETSQKEARKIELSSALGDMSQKGLITKPQREWALKTFADAVDLSSFREWAKTCTKPVVHLNDERGAGGSDEPVGEAGQQLISLANTIAKEKGISLSRAISEASAQMPEAAEAYREAFA